MSEQHTTPPPPPVPLPAPASGQPEVVIPARTPRAGELSPGWRVTTAIVWVAVVLAFAAVWNTSVQLGLSTWWLGPRADRQPMIIRLSPFFAPILMLLGTINHVRWLAWWGLAASGVLAIYGVGDLARVGSIAVLELLVAAAAAAASIASITGTYQRRPADDSADDLATPAAEAGSPPESR